MPDSPHFDPYYKWLGIRPEHQPADHYRILGLDSYESDREVIRSAAERQAAHLQSFKIGPQSELSQRLLNEVAQAKICLLNERRKAEYDLALRAKRFQSATEPPIEPVGAPPVSYFDNPRAAAPARAVTKAAPRRATPTPAPLPSPRTKKRRKKEFPWGAVIINGGILLALVALAIVLLNNSAKPDKKKLAATDAVPTASEGIIPPQPSAPAESGRADPKTPGKPTNARGPVGGKPDVPRAALPERNVPAPPAPPPAASEAPSDASKKFQSVSVSPGRLIRADDFVPRLPASTRNALYAPPEGAALFILKPVSSNSPARGVFTFDSRKNLEGPAVVMHPAGQLKMILHYDNNLRHDLTRVWNEEGQLMLFAEFKNGKQFGMACLCQNGRPVLIEEWDSRQKPDTYFVEPTGSLPKLVGIDAADEVTHLEMDRLTVELHEAMAQVAVEEGEWKKDFRRWWEKNDGELKRKQRAKDKAQGLKRDEWIRQITNHVETIKKEAGDTARELLGKLP